MSLLSNLRALHAVDSQVRGIRTRFDNAERDLKRHQVQLDALAGKRRELETQAKQLQAAVSNLELEDGSFKQRIEQLRNELNTSANPRQYNALRDELKVIEGKRDGLAERMLAQMENLEKLKSELAAGETPIADRTRLRDLAKAALDEAKSELGGRLAELESQRARAAGLLSEDARSAFDEAAEQNEGEALAEVTVISVRHREFACGGCNAEIPLDAYSRASAQTDQLVTCNNCGRILYMETVPEKPGAKKTKAQAKEAALDPDGLG
jgi:predicted  nucleic acid-binding Zn-ribbon protein